MQYRVSVRAESFFSEEQEVEAMNVCLRMKVEGSIVGVGRRGLTAVVRAG